ncbi:MAG: HD domain-containing protein [Chloroflexi bacterium]|nr:HD domain-containing protein [Chloroflexota bacterium]
MTTKPHFSAVESSIFKFLRLQPDSLIYLVGGAVRDELFGKPSHDLDFVVSGNVFVVARALADYLHGFFYILDNDRKYARVIYETANTERHVIDFAPVLAGDLEKDLRARDFTINAIAREINSREGQLIDPCGGINDLQKKILRPCSSTCFRDDPVRIIRVARFVASYGLQPSPQVTDLVPLSISGLSSISQERKRDEFFKMLDGKNVVQGLSILYDMGVLQQFLPELTSLINFPQGSPHIHNGWQHTLQAMQYCELMANHVQLREQFDHSMPMVVDIFRLLDEYQNDLRTDFGSHLVFERSRRILFLFAALYHDVGKPLDSAVEQSGRYRYPHHQVLGAEKMRRRAVTLALSRVEVQWLQRFVAHHMDLHDVVLEDDQDQRSALFRFYQAAKDTTPFVALFSLADLLATYGDAIPQQRWQLGLSRCRLALQGWYDCHQELVDPKLYFNGDELQQHFGIKPGKQLGALLISLKEAQAAGRVRSKQAAEQWLRKKISDLKE